jgi:hypothetical protein
VSAVTLGSQEGREIEMIRVFVVSLAATTVLGCHPAPRETPSYREKATASSDATSETKVAEAEEARKADETQSAVEALKAKEALIDRERTIAASFDKVWAALIEVAFELGLPVESVEKGSGLFTVKNMSVNSDLCHYLTNPAVIVTRARMKMSVLVKPVSEATSVIKLNCDFEAFNGLSGRWGYICPSTGKFETDLLDRVEAQVMGK